MFGSRIINNDVEYVDNMTEYNEDEDKEGNLTPSPMSCESAETVGEAGVAKILRQYERDSLYKPASYYVFSRLLPLLTDMGWMRVEDVSLQLFYLAPWAVSHLAEMNMSVNVNKNTDMKANATTDTDTEAETEAGPGADCKSGMVAEIDMEVREQEKEKEKAKEKERENEKARARVEAIAAMESKGGLLTGRYDIKSIVELVENRDYFKDNKKLVAYLSKHGCRRIEGEPSPASVEMKRKRRSVDQGAPYGLVSAPVRGPVRVPVPVPVSIPVGTVVVAMARAKANAKAAAAAAAVSSRIPARYAAQYAASSSSSSSSSCGVATAAGYGEPATKKQKKKVPVVPIRSQGDRHGAYHGGGGANGVGVNGVSGRRGGVTRGRPDLIDDDFRPDYQALRAMILNRNVAVDFERSGQVFRVLCEINRSWHWMYSDLGTVYCRTREIQSMKDLREHKEGVHYFLTDTALLLFVSSQFAAHGDNIDLFQSNSEYVPAKPQKTKRKLNEKVLEVFEMRKRSPYKGLKGNFEEPSDNLLSLECHSLSSPLSMTSPQSHSPSMSSSQSSSDSQASDDNEENQSVSSTPDKKELYRRKSTGSIEQSGQSDSPHGRVDMGSLRNTERDGTLTHTQQSSRISRASFDQSVRALHTAQIPDSHIPIRPQPPRVTSTRTLRETISLARSLLDVKNTPVPEERGAETATVKGLIISSLLALQSGHSAASCKAVNNVYACGLPGYGKTLTVNQVLRDLTEQRRKETEDMRDSEGRMDADNIVLPSFEIVTLQGTTVSTDSIYQSIAAQMCILGLGEGTGVGSARESLAREKVLARFLNTRQCVGRESNRDVEPITILMIDEIDKAPRKQVRELLEIASAATSTSSCVALGSAFACGLIVVGVANDLHFSSSSGLSHKAQERLSVVCFRPYELSQLQSILTKRSLGIFDERALFLIASRGLRSERGE